MIVVMCCRNKELPDELSCYDYRANVSMVVDDPHFTPMGIDLWEMMEKIKLDDPEYVKVLVLPENDGSFDDVEEDLELKEVQAKDDDQ
ncbi:hypothetical protein RIF29_20434 [Crotalaria pallida]|uniref:Uncharacterized protein n=1 Tax=Crotalaria pallida TaxID=3830 RepID=A0AAN9F3F6_CROPI